MPVSAPLATDPFAKFQEWMNEAWIHEPEDANAMTLATATTDGLPSARIVLMKGVDADRGFVRGKPDLDDTLHRLQAYEKAGADVLFAPALPDLAAVRAVCSAVSRPVNFMVGMRGGPGTNDPAQATFTNMTLRMLLGIAYKVHEYQVLGPSWLDTERFDIVAKVPAGATREEFAVMQQNLQAVGVNVTFERMEWAAFLAKAIKGLDDSTAGLYTGWDTGAQDPYWFETMFSAASQPPNGPNRAWYSNNTVNQLLNSGRHELNNTQRIATYRKAAAIIILPVIRIERNVDASRLGPSRTKPAAKRRRRTSRE